MSLANAAEGRRERSLAFSLLADTVLWLVYAVVSLGAGSLPMLAETVRGAILIALGWWILLILRRMHRRRLTEYEFGAGKLERFANLLLGVLMLLGALWVAARAIATYLAGPQPPVADAGGWMLAAQVLAAVNVLLNAVALLVLWRAARDGASLILRGQVQTRAGKLATSVLVLAAVMAAAAWPGTWLAWIANIAGGLLVVAVMLGVAFAMVREAIPDLLDRALDEQLQMTITTSLGRHFYRFDTLEHVRSRQSGQRLYIEISLGFDPERSFGDVAEVARGLAQELEGTIQGAEVTVVPVLSRT